MEEAEFAKQLLESGKRLLKPPVDVDPLMDALDQVESFLSKVEQSPTTSMLDALEPSRQALIAEQLLRHADKDVKVAVASCISEVTRITAPDAPYDDNQMKEIFSVIVSTFEDLSDISSQSYHRRVSILETVAKVRSCVVMLDLECDDLILEMFQHFIKCIRDDHPDNVFTSMLTIMTLVLEESEEITPELLGCLLKCVKREDEDVSPIAQKLGAKVIASCSERIKPYVLQDVKSKRISLDSYDTVVASLCHETSDALEQNGFSVHDKDDNENKLFPRADGNKSMHDTEKVVGPGTLGSNNVIAEGGQTPKKRGRKPKTTPSTDAADHPQIDSKKDIVNSCGQKDTGSMPRSPSAKDRAAPSRHERKLYVVSPSNRKNASKFDIQCNYSTRPKRGRPAKRSSNDPMPKEENKIRDSGVANDLNLKSDGSKSTSEDTTLKVSRLSVETGPRKELASVKEGSRRKSRGTPINKEGSKGSEKKKMSSGKKTTKLDAHKSRQGKEMPKTTPKRKRMSDKINEVALDETLVGSKIEVYWPDDEMYYQGVVDSFDPIKKKHRILYSDGDEEILRLKKENWRYIDGGNAPDREQVTPKGDGVSELPLKKKMRTVSESTKRERNEETPKRGVVSRGKSSDGSSAKLGRKLKSSDSDKSGKKSEDGISKSSLSSLKHKDDSLSSTLKNSKRIMKGNSSKSASKRKGNLGRSGMKSAGVDSKTVSKLDLNGDASEKSKSVMTPKGRKSDDSKVGLAPLTKPTKDEESPAAKGEDSSKGKQISENAQGNDEKSGKKRKAQALC